MQCPRCQAQNAVDARFCEDCGARLALACPQCGSEVSPGKRFCRSCGTALPGGSTATVPVPASYTPKHLAEKILTSRGALEGERKQVTVLFADLKGSMELLADRDPEEARKLLDPVLERMMEAVHRYEGTVNQVMGDGIMALFGAPVAHEDHAVRACYAALDLQAAQRRYAEEVRRTQGVKVQVRVGLNSGEVVVRAVGSDLRMDYSAVGQTTHLAARMEQLADPGSTLLTADTLRLAEGYVEVKPLGPVPVKGLETPVEVYELVGAGPLRSRLRVAAAQGLTRFVGRERELEQLRSALGQAATGHGQIVAIVGEPGVGKSRLVWEITHSHRTHGWLIVQSGSLSYGKATPFLPVIDLLKAYFQVEDRDDQRKVREKVVGKLLTLDDSLKPTLPAFLGLLDVPVDDPQWQALDPPQRRQRMLDAIKRLLLRESQGQPLLVIFEDLHWIDRETQALLDLLVGSLPTARLLLLVNYRPEYEHRWGSKTYYTQLRLDPLPPESAEELLDALLGDEASLQPVKGLLIERTEGNPFFLEESVRTLVETKVLAGERGAYQLAKAVPTIQVPATVQAVLAARIDRLPPEEKRLLQAASVIGKDVPVTLLQAIADQPEDALRRALGHLQAAEFLYEARLFPEHEYTFKHALTHEVAYGSLLHERRRALHRHVGEAVERLFPDRAEEWDTVLAHHFIQSGDPAKGLQYSRRAAARAERLFAHDEALRSLEQARACAEALNRSDELAAVYEAIGDVHYQRGRFQPAIREAYQRAAALATSREQRARLTFLLGRSYPFAHPRRRDFLQAALEELDPVTQASELAQATASLARYHHDQGQHAKAIGLLDRARQLAEPLDDAETLMYVYAFLAGAHRDLAQMAESMAWARRCIELGERKGYLVAVALGSEFLAETLALLGQWQESLACSTRNYQTGERIGQQHRMAWAEHDRARALYGLGDLASAVVAAQAALPLADATGDARLAVLASAILSRSQADLAKDDVALVTAQTAVARSEDVHDPVIRGHSRHALAYVHGQREEWEAAADLARQCTELLAETDDRVLPLVSGADLAEVAWRRGQRDEARRLIDENLTLARDARCRHYEAVAQRVQGQICAAVQSWDEAAGAFNQAIEILEELGSRLELGRALYGRGILRRARGQAASGREDLTRARALFAEIGARRDLERVVRRAEATYD